MYRYVQSYTHAHTYIQVLGHFFLNGPLDLIMCIGACTVIMSIFNYTMDSTLKQNIQNGSSSQNERLQVKNSNMDLSSSNHDSGHGRKEDV